MSIRRVHICVYARSRLFRSGTITGDAARDRECHHLPGCNIVCLSPLLHDEVFSSARLKAPRKSVLSPRRSVLSGFNLRHERTEARARSLIVLNITIDVGALLGDVAKGPVTMRARNILKVVPRENYPFEYTRCPGSGRAHAGAVGFIVEHGIASSSAETRRQFLALRCGTSMTIKPSFVTIS